MISETICTALLAESSITAYLGSYGGSYGVFNFEPAPLDATGLIITVVDESNVVDDTRLTNSGDITLLIKIWGDKDYDLSNLYEVSDLIRDFLHRKTNYEMGSDYVMNAICEYPQYTVVDGYPLSLMRLVIKLSD